MVAVRRGGIMHANADAYVPARLAICAEFLVIQMGKEVSRFLGAVREGRCPIDFLARLT